MHDQTCPELLGNDVRAQIRAARQLVKDWPPLRLILVAVIVLWLGGMGLWKLFSGTETQDQEPLDSSTVLVADEYIPAYSPVKKSMVTVKDFPRNIVPPGSLHSLRELMADNGQTVYTAAVAVPVGHPLTSSVLIDNRKTYGMAAILPNGKVAVSFAVDKVRGAGGWIQPGDHVAIYLTSRSLENGLHSPPTSRLLFPAASVIAVDKNRLGQASHQADRHNGLLDTGESQDASGSILTLSMNLVEATALIQAEEQGHLTVAIRAIGDDLSATEALASPPKP